jgi:hypothetical protein
VDAERVRELVHGASAAHAHGGDHHAL